MHFMHLHCVYVWKMNFNVYNYSALAFSHKLPPPLPLVEKEGVPESEQEEADELESDL